MKLSALSILLGIPFVLGMAIGTLPRFRRWSAPGRRPPSGFGPARAGHSKRFTR